MFANSTTSQTAILLADVLPPALDTTITISNTPDPTSPSDEEELVPIDEPTSNDKEPITEAYYYKKLRESADRFAYQLSTSKYVDDVELTWRGFDDKKKELVITSAMRYVTFDPDTDFKRFDDLAMAAMTSVMLNIVRTSKKSTIKKPVGNALLRRAVFQATGDRDSSDTNFNHLAR